MSKTWKHIHSSGGFKVLKTEMYPKARTVMAQATIEDAPAAAKLSFLHALMWLLPANFDTIPTTPASMEKVKKNIVAPFPPKPEKVAHVSISRELNTYYIFWLQD